MRELFLLLFFSVKFLVFGQIQFGYIITLDNDTLYGEIKDEFIIKSDPKPHIKFRKPTDEKTIELDVSQDSHTSDENSVKYCC